MLDHLLQFLGIFWVDKIIGIGVAAIISKYYVDDLIQTMHDQVLRRHWDDLENGQAVEVQIQQFIKGLKLNYGAEIGGDLPGFFGPLNS